MPARRTEYLDGPEAHLPHGMRHVGYDADAETHQYLDRDGSLWQSAPGNRYGRLRLVRRGAAEPEDEGRRRRREKQREAREARRSAAAAAAEDEAPPPYSRRRAFTNFDQLHEVAE